MGDICTRVFSGGTPDRSKEHYFVGEIPWIRTQEVDFNEISSVAIKISKEALENSSAQWVKPDTVILAMYGATAGKAAILRVPATTNQACCNFELDQNIARPEYVFHWLMENYEMIKSLGQGTQSNLSAKIVKELIVPIPSLSKQDEILNVLENFRSLTMSIGEGLPAEIAARRQQYEYYRNKLLTFKELEVA